MLKTGMHILMHILHNYLIQVPVHDFAHAHTKVSAHKIRGCDIVATVVVREEIEIPVHARNVC